MATKKKTSEPEVQMAQPEVKVKEKQNPKREKWMVVGWVVLLFGGLAHMLPEQMEPLVKWSMWGVSVQMAVGVAAVILALNFLLED